MSLIAKSLIIKMSKKQKKKIIQISLAILLFVAAFVSEKLLVKGLIIENGSIWFLFMYIVPYLIVGWKVIAEAGENILHGQIFDENFLMVIASIGALCIGEYPEAVAVMIFFQIGELFEDIAVGKSRKSIAALMDIKPEYANLIDGDKISKVKPEKVEIGDIVLVKPGEKVPLDGIIEQGSSSLNTVALTGESLPRDVSENDGIISGCINMRTPLRVRVTSKYEDSTVKKILELVENSAANKAPSENFITKFAKFYTPIVVACAVLLAVLPPLVNILTKSVAYTTVGAGAIWTEWIRRALTFLVISCPCALVISVPLSFFAGIGSASKQGVLIKGSNYLEALSKAKIIAFDKTGTLTKGNFTVTAIHPNKISEDELLETACLAELYSDHPISLALKGAYKKPIESKRVSNIVEIAGKGISGMIDGRKVYVGNGKYMETLGIDYHDCSQVGTIVHIAIEDEYAGHIVISDQIKADSRQAILDLRALGIKTVMLTGDRKNVGESIGKKLKLNEYYCELLPKDKVEKVEELIKQKGKKEKLVFVGDGINDAPVLTRADVGIAMGALGSDAAIETADIVLMNDKPSDIVKAIRLSKRTRKIVVENISFALGVKLIILILGALGIANMWFAVFADVGVSVIAILNAMRCLKVNK